MKKTTNPALVMATICLNFSYTHLEEKSKLQLYQYGFSEFKSGYVRDLKIEKDSRGQTIVVCNYTIVQLFAIAYGAGAPINKDQIIIDTIEPKKLQEIRCYRLFVPQQQIDSFYTIMQQNLHMEFPDYKITIRRVESEKFMIIVDA